MGLRLGPMVMGLICTHCTYIVIGLRLGRMVFLLVFSLKVANLCLVHDEYIKREV